LCFSFLRKSKLVARKQGRYAQKASAGKEFQPEIPSRFRRKRRAYRALPNSEFGMGNSEFFASLSIPHSAIGIPHFGCPPGPRNDARLMILARNALAFGPGNA
jgi:hypothetical protein